MQAIDYLKKANTIHFVTTSILFAGSLLGIILLAITLPSSTKVPSYDLFRFIFSFIITTTLLILGILIKNKLKNFEPATKIRKIIVITIIVLSIGICVPFLLFNPKIHIAKLYGIVTFVLSIISLVNYNRGLKQLNRDIKNN